MSEKTAKYIIGSVFDDRGAKAASKAFDDLGKRSAALAKQMATVGAAAVAAGAAIVAGLTKAGIEAIDSQAKLARSIGGTIDGLRGLQIALGDAGVNNEALTSAVQKLNARLGEAQRGTGEAKKALDILGLSARQLADMDVDQRVAAIADRVKELGLSSSQTADVLRNLGVRSAEMVDVLRNGGDAIRAARQEVDDFGLSVSAVDAAQVEAANDAMERIGRTMEGLKNQLAIAFAPMLKELSDRFLGLVKDSGGFRTQATQTAEAILNGFGRVADVLHIVQMGAKGLQLAFATVGEVFWKSVQAIGEVLSNIGDAFTVTANLVIRAMNALGASITELPTLSNSEFMHGLRSVADTASEITDQVRTEFLDLANQEWPSAGIDRFLEDVKRKSQEAGEAAAAAMPGGGSFESTDEEAEKKAKKDEERRLKELEAEREALQAKLDQVVEFAATEDELELARHEAQLTTLREALEAELVTEEEFYFLKEELEEKHQSAMASIRKKGLTDLEKFTKASYSTQVGMISGYLADITAGVARENKAMFELNKAAGIANAVVAAYEGISKTLGAYPYPINIGLAAAHAVAAFAQVRAIASQSFSGGGSTAPSLAGGTPATPVTPVNGGTPQSSGGGGSLLTVEGVSPDALFSGRTVRALAERLAEHQRDGGSVQFAT